MFKCCNDNALINILRCENCSLLHRRNLEGGGQMPSPQTFLLAKKIFLASEFKRDKLKKKIVLGLECRERGVCILSSGRKEFFPSF